MEKIKQENNLTIPNLLTALRIILVPFFIWQYLRGHSLTALVIFLIVQLTDLLDGMIARKFGQVTSLGKLLDPIADKLLLLSVLACLTLRPIEGRGLPLWVLFVVLGKEALTLLGGAFALRRKVVVQSQFLGKAATFLFAGTIVVILLGYQTLGTVLLYISLATSLGALVFYGVQMYKGLRDGTYGNNPLLPKGKH